MKGLQFLIAHSICVPYSEGTKNIVCDIGRRLTEATGDQRQTYWFMQRLSLAVQRGNDASIICGERERQRYFG